MAKKKTPNELYWISLRNRQIEEEYANFLEVSSQPRNPDTAWQFAMKKIYDGYREMSERELILLVSDELPYMYD